MGIEIKKWYFCDWPGCGKEVMPYGQDEPKIMIVVLQEVVCIDGIFCPEHAEELLKKGKIIDPYLLKSDVDQAIKDGKIVM